MRNGRSVISRHAPVDRRTAVETILSSVDAARVVGPALWVVEGAEGLGRTTVLDRLSAALGARTSRTCVLRSSGVAWESEHEYGVLHQLMRDASGVSYSDPLRAAQALAATLPRDAAALVMVDDAQLADLASLRALATIVRHHPTCALVVVLTAQAGVDAAGELIAHLDGRTLTLAPMTTEEVSQTAAEMSVALTRSQAEHLAHHTGGVPRHVVALLTSLPADVWTSSRPTLPAPASVVHAVRERLARLDPSARAVTEAVAVLHDPVAISTAGAVAMVTDVLRAVDEAEREGLLVVRDRTSSVALELPDHLTRAAVRADMGPTRRAQLSRVAAEVVPDLTAALEYAAAATTGPDEELAARLQALAGERASEGAWAAAAHLYLLSTRMTSLPDRREPRLLLAVDAMVGAGDVAATVGYLAEIESFSETSMRNVVLGYLAIVRGRAAEAHSRLARAWELSRGQPPALRAMIAQRHVLHHLARCEGEKLVEWADRTVELVGEDHPTAVEAQAIRGLGLAGAGRTQEALSSYEALQTRAGHGAVGQRVRMGAGWLHLATDDVDSARTELASAVPTDFLGGSQRISLWARCWLARTHFVTGEWDRAMHVVDEGLVQAERSGMVIFAPLLHWTRTQILALRGDRDAAHASALGGDQGPREYAIMRVPACLAHAALCEARADYTGVLDALAPMRSLPGTSSLRARAATDPPRRGSPTPGGGFSERAENSRRRGAASRRRSITSTRCRCPMTGRASPLPMARPCDGRASAARPTASSRSPATTISRSARRPT